MSRSTTDQTRRIYTVSTDQPRIKFQNIGIFFLGVVLKNLTLNELPAMPAGQKATPVGCCLPSVPDPSD